MKKYQNARGTVDLLPNEIGKWQTIRKLIDDMCFVYGYKEIQTPMFEDTGVFKREHDTSDMVTKEMYTFSKNGVDSLTLRPEGTAGVVRSFVQHKMYGNQELPAKLYYVGPMFRYERPQKGRQRQFHQFGVENIGVKSPLVDAETIALGYSVVKALGLSHVKVLINTLGDEASRKNYDVALREHFKEEQHNLCSDCKRRYEVNPLRILDCKVDHEKESIKHAPKMDDYLTEESKQYFNEVKQALDALDIPYEVEPSLVRGLDYYTHTVFEVVSTHPESGAQATIFGGGRYDGMVEYFGGPSLSGVGFAIGMERLLILAEAEQVDLNKHVEADVYVMSLGEVGNVPLVVTSQLRANGYYTEYNIEPRSLKAQFKSVDRFKAKVVVIVGQDELKEHKVSVKDIASQKQVQCDIDELIHYVDHFFEECHEGCQCGKE